jgi:hypothetical protein
MQPNTQAESAYPLGQLLLAGKICGQIGCVTNYATII